nr:MAG TPA: hypothetical protein [Caudoviricetes sp.]
MPAIRKSTNGARDSVTYAGRTALTRALMTAKLAIMFT